MKCYRSSEECWGEVSLVSVNGRVGGACSGHMQAKYRPPVLEIDIVDADVADGKTITGYLNIFIDEEIKEAEFTVFGKDGFGEIYAEILAFKNKKAKLGKGRTTHLFAVVDLLACDFSYMDNMLGNGVVVNTVTL